LLGWGRSGFDPSSDKTRPVVVRSEWLVMSGSVTLVAWLTLIPLGFLVWQSFMTPQSFSKPAQFTLGNYLEAYGSPETFELLSTSVLFAVGSSVFALFLGSSLAWMNERTNTPFKSIFYALSIIPLVVPGILFVVSWIMLASPKIGLINLFFRSVFNTDYTFVDCYSLRRRTESGTSTCGSFVLRFPSWRRGAKSASGA
jgi:iron(III) transport system permease protein